jgi:hypothetical protein
MPPSRRPLRTSPICMSCGATLEVVLAIVEAAWELGFKDLQQRLIRRIPGTVLVEALCRNEPVAILHAPQTGARLRIIPQRSFGQSGPLQSVSFEQVPDLAVEVDQPGHETEVYLFDPKYKFRAFDDRVMPVDTSKNQWRMRDRCDALDVIARFGRHPHRNAVLGRTSTEDERAYLASGELVHRRSFQG